MTPNSTLKKAVIAVSGGLLIAFICFTIHRIYVEDPKVYAQKADVTAFMTESRNDRSDTKALATQNKEAITEMRTNFKWIKESQEELKLQNANTQASQMKILEALKDLKK